MQGASLRGNQGVQMCQASEKRRLTPARMMESLHGEERAVDGVMGLIQHGAHRRHLRVFEHRIPARLFVLKPTPHALALILSNRGRDVVRKTAQALAQRHHPYAGRVPPACG
jgi:hypothetical protein